MASEKKDAASENAALQKQVDAELDQGLVGVKVDPTPNAHYTVDGVTSGKPTPETDAGAADKARLAVANKVGQV